MNLATGLAHSKRRLRIGTRSGWRVRGRERHGRRRRDGRLRGGGAAVAVARRVRCAAAYNRVGRRIERDVQ